MIFIRALLTTTTSQCRISAYNTELVTAQLYKAVMRFMTQLEQVAPQPGSRQKFGVQMHFSHTNYTPRFQPSHGPSCAQLSVTCSMELGEGYGKLSGT